MSKRKEVQKKIPDLTIKRPKSAKAGRLRFYLDVSSVGANQNTSQSTVQTNDPSIELTYKSTDLRTSLHGDVFQLRLLMLFLHRAAKHYKNFYLATEMDAAQKFDDVVLRFEEKEKPSKWAWRFLQAKHTANVENKKITEWDLLTDKKDYPMSLIKYVKSLSDIKTCSPFSDSNLDSFILCFNHSITKETESHLIRCGNEPDPILDFKQHFCWKYKLNPNSILSDTYKKKHKNCKNTFKEELIANYRIAYGQDPVIDDLEDFFCKFRIVIRYPNKDKLMEYINKELGEQLNLLNAQLATRSFQDDVLSWFAEYNTSEGRYLMIKDVKSFMNTLEVNIETLMTAGLSKARPEKLQSYKVKFRQMPPWLFNVEQIQVMRIKTNSPLLTAIKVAQFLKSQENYKAHDSYIFLTLDQCMLDNIKTLACSSFNSDTSHHLFVIECQNNTPFEDNDLCERLEYTLYNYKDEKHLLIITNEPSIQFSNDIQINQTEDTNNFGEFDDDSQKNILRNIIRYQDNYLRFDELINIHAAQQLFDLTILERLLRQEDVQIEAVRTNKFDSFNPTMYITRTLRRQVVSWDIMLERLVKSTIFFVIGIDESHFKKHVQKCAADVVIFPVDIDTGIVLVPNSTIQNQDIFKRYKSRNMFIFEYSNRFLFWNDFRGNPAEVFKHAKDGPLFDNIPEEEVSKISNLMKKINILVDDPGWGKSSLIGSLALNMKRNNKELWVIKINLNDHFVELNKSISKDIVYKSLMEVNFVETDMVAAVTFLVEMAFPKDWEKDETRFQKRFLWHSLCYTDDNCIYPKVALLFDGFDEISPMFKKQTLTLLKGLILSKAEYIWVTSRVHEKESLENKLAGVAYRLNPFTDQQKKDYIRILWNSRSTDGSDFEAAYDQIQTFVYNRLIDGKRMDFTNVPLHLKMLTDVLVRHKGVLPQNFDLYDLYEDFIEAKFHIYYNEKKTSGSSMGALESQSRDIPILKNTHQNIAFSLFFPELANVTLLDQITKNNLESLCRVGLLVPGGQLVRFIHQSFAEYFLAEYISRHMNDEAVQTNIFDVLTADQFKVTRMFLNKIPLFITSLRNIIKLVIQRNKDSKFKLLNKSIDDSNLNIFECITNELIPDDLTI